MQIANISGITYNAVIQLVGVIKSNSRLHQMQDQINSILFHMVIWERLLLILQLNTTFG